MSNEQPPRKKAKLVKDEATALVSGGGAHLSPELIARVAQFSTLADGTVWNTCLAVGPGVSRTIRHVFLKKNEPFLKRTLQKFNSNDWDKSKANANHVAWMEVNTDWMTTITAERMEELKEATTTPWDGRRLLPRQIKDHPFLAFNNPAIAIQLGLCDVLRCLVEEKEIDINATKWVGYFSSRPMMRPLSCYCVGRGDHNPCNTWEGDMTLYRYLLGLPSFAIERHLGFVLDFVLPSRKCVPYLRAITEHRDVSKYANEELKTCVQNKTPLECVLWTLFSFLSRSRKLDEYIVRSLSEAVEQLLKAGAEPNLRNAVGQMSAIDYCKLQKEHSVLGGRGMYWDNLASLLEKYRN